MPKHDLDSLFDKLDALTVGYGPLFRSFHVPTINYPPHNIVKASDTEFYLELAVAGFKRDEIALEFLPGTITVRGDKKAQETGQVYQHHGIGGRSFTKSLRVAEYFEVDNATLEDGILTVKFVKNVPEEAKPKLIAIK